MDDLLDRLTKNSGASFGRMTAGGLSFFESRLQPAGAIYTVLEVLPFT